MMASVDQAPEPGVPAHTRANRAVHRQREVDLPLANGLQDRHRREISLEKLRHHAVVIE